MNKVCKFVVVVCVCIFSVYFFTVQSLATENIDEIEDDFVFILLDQSSVKIYCGMSYTLDAFVYGSEDKVEWTSSDKNIATVNQSGKITAKKKGNVKITAKVNGVKDSCTVKVVNPKTNKDKAMVAYYKMLKKGYRYEKYGKKKEKEVFKKWILLNLGDSDIPELCVLTKKGKTIVYCYRNGKIQNACKNSKVRGVNDDDYKYVKNYSPGLFNNRSLIGDNKYVYYNAKYKCISYLGKQKVGSICVKKGKLYSDTWYGNSNAYYREFRKKDAESNGLYMYNLKNMDVDEIDEHFDLCG